jgi:glycosyltransferase involved in cell wall biosynthesis
VTTPPPRVVLVSPPLDASGGIGRVMSYALAALPPGTPVRVLDSRGHARHPVLSLFPLLRVCATLAVLGLTRAADVAHVNLSSHGSTLRKWAVVAVCRAVRVPVVLHLHASSYPAFFDRLPGAAQRAVRRMFQRAASVVVLSESWRAYVCGTLAVPPGRVTVLPNAAPAGCVPAGLGNRPEVLFLGRLGERKGVPELLAALTRPGLAHVHTTLAGDGPVEEYRRRAADLGLAARTHLPGWVDAATARDLLARAHVLVLPSHAEGSPMAVIEAFAHGVPVVATPVGGIPELVTDGVDGLLVPPGDPDALAAALIRLLTDEPLRAGLAAGARATWARTHTMDAYAAGLSDVWRHVHGGEPATPATTARRP